MDWMKLRKFSFCGVVKIYSVGPSSAICPSWMNRTRFATLRANPISWVTTWQGRF